MKLERICNIVMDDLLGCEQAWTPNIYLESFDMDSLQVGKAVFVKESFTTLGIEPRTYSYLGRLAAILVSVGLLMKSHLVLYTLNKRFILLGDGWSFFLYGQRFRINLS